MKLTVKATVLILLVSLLSGCSSSPTPVDKPQAKSECQSVYEATAKYKAEIEDYTSGKKKMLSAEIGKITMLSWAYSIIDNAECYEPGLIAQARAMAATYSTK